MMGESTTPRRAANDDLAELVAAAREQSDAAAVDAHRDELGLILLEVGERWYAVLASAVSEVIDVASVTRIPRSPDHIRGAVAVHGRLLTVVSLAAMAGHETTVDFGSHRLAIVQWNGVELGLVADRARGIIPVPASDIITESTSAARPPWITGEVEHEQHLVSVVDVSVLTRVATEENP
jgi:purine-binding chemotaxis protein CheW